MKQNHHEKGLLRGSAHVLHILVGNDNTFTITITTNTIFIILFFFLEYLKYQCICFKYLLINKQN